MAYIILLLIILINICKIGIVTSNKQLASFLSSCQESIIVFWSYKPMRKILILLALLLVVACSDEVPTHGETSTVEFEQLVTEVDNDQYTLEHPIKLEGVSIGKGVQIGGSVKINGVQLGKIKDAEIIVKNVNDVMVVQTIE